MQRMLQVWNTMTCAATAGELLAGKPVRRGRGAPLWMQRRCPERQETLLSAAGADQHSGGHRGGHGAAGVTELAFWIPGITDRQQASDEATAERSSFQPRLPVAVHCGIVAGPSAGRAVTRGAHGSRLGMKSSFVMDVVSRVGPCRPASADGRAFPNALRRGFRSMVEPSGAIGVVAPAGQ